MQSKRTKTKTKPAVHVEAKHPTPALPPAFEALAHVLAGIERRMAVRVKRPTR